MDALEIMHNVNDISNNLLVLFEKKEQKDIKLTIKEINKKLDAAEKSTELSKFVADTRKLISIFEDIPVDETKKSESFLNLISLISTERSKIIEKFSFCSEPE